LAERRAEIDGRAALAQADLTEAQDQLAASERSADQAARAVTEAREAQADAARGIADANYNAQRAALAVEEADRNVEKASRDVEQAKWDQLKASEELTKKIGEEQLAFAGANAEAAQLADYFRNLIALHPELAGAIQPLLDLLTAAAVLPPASGRQTTAPTRDVMDGPGGPAAPTGGGGPSATYRPPGIYDGVYWPGGIIYSGAPNAAASGNSSGAQVTQINNFAPMDPEEAITVANQRLAQAVGW
jgi:multidrug efflux pump subunit AcrA (membrane-fusion protein)